MPVRSFPNFSFKIKEKLKYYTEALILELNETPYYFNNLPDNVCLKNKKEINLQLNFRFKFKSFSRALFRSPFRACVSVKCC